MTSSPPLLITSGNSPPLVTEENLEKKETCNGREFAEMPLRSGNERDVRHPGHQRELFPPQDLKGQGRKPASELEIREDEELRRAQPAPEQDKAGHAGSPDVSLLHHPVSCQGFPSSRLRLRLRLRARCVDRKCLPGAQSRARKANRNPRNTQSSGPAWGTGVQLQLSHRFPL